MKRIPLAAIVMIFSFTGIISADVLIKPNDTNINYYGRFDFSNSATSVAFNWPGAIIEATFPGPSIGAELSDGGSSYFNVEIDGVLVDSISPSTTTHRTISTTLSTANHTIRITLRSNGYNCTFGGFYLANGSVLAARPAKPTRRIEYIGDSWTAGDCIGQTTGTPNTEYFNASLTYARVTSKAFHAEDHLTARGGCGLIKSQGGAAVMATRFPETVCDQATPLWNFTSWTPDLVSILLGINDFSIGGVADTSFISSYKSFITTVRTKYPNVPIILIGLSAAISGHSILTDVQTVAQSFTGITVFSSPITTANASQLYQHPSKAQHQLISDSLIPVIERVMGWDTAAPVGVRVPEVKQEAQLSPGAIIRTTQDRVVFPSRFSGMEKAIVAYDCAGREMRKMVTGKQTVSLSKDLGLRPGMYLIKTSVLGKSR